MEDSGDKPMNILMVVVDTLRYDYLGAYGNDWIETPNMDRLASQSWVFDYNFAHSYPTIPHRTDVLTGQYGDPFHAWMPLRHDRVTFPQEMGKAGFCTQLIHDTPHLVSGGQNFDWPFHFWTSIRGAGVDRPWMDSPAHWPENWARDPLFDFVDDERLATWRDVTYIRANHRRREDAEWNCAKLFRTAAEWLRQNGSLDDFLLWVDSFDPHEPWDSPPEFVLKYDRRPGYDGRLDPRSFIGRNDEQMSEEAKSHVAAQYAAKVTWVDRWLGELMSALEETGLAKSTAVLFTADHGTNVGERGRFGKGFPVREQEAHTPLMLRVPGDRGGRSDVIVQPQDIYATVMGLAGLPVSEGLDSHDVLGLARQGKRGPRSLALSSNSADNWTGAAVGNRDPSPSGTGQPNSSDKTIFNAFNRKWALEFAPNPEYCRLSRLGAVQDVAAENPSVVEEMHAAAIEEVRRMGMDPKLAEWVRSEGETEFPSDCKLWDGYPGPAGYFRPHSYSRLYSEPQ
jgi:arylsulfatase A-like enzyme